MFPRSAPPSDDDREGAEWHPDAAVLEPVYSRAFIEQLHADARTAPSPRNVLYQLMADFLGANLRTAARREKNRAFRRWLLALAGGEGASRKVKPRTTVKRAGKALEKARG